MTTPQSPKISPKRRALHERTDSHTNEVTSPTLRIVDDPEAHIYSSNPFPTQPSHILSPTPGAGAGAGQGLLFEEDEAVSDKITSTKAFAGPSSSSNTNTRRWKGKGRAIAKTTNVSEEGSPSNVHALPSLPSAPDYSQATIPALFSPPRQHIPKDSGIDLERHEYDKIAQLPSTSEPNAATCRPSLPEAPSAAPPLRDIPARESLVPQPPQVSTETVERPRTAGRSNRISYSAFPPLERPSSSRSARSSSTPLAQPTPTFDRSTASPSQPSEYAQGCRTSSVPSHANLQAAINSGANIQYPIVRPPVASGSWAETSISIPKRTTQRGERNTSRRWNPQLSVVHSESSEGSNEQRPVPRQEGVPASVSSSTVVENQSNQYPPLEPPLALFPRNRDGTGSTIRVVDQDEDRNMHSQSQPPPSQGSGFRSMLSSKSIKRKPVKSSEVRTEPGSRGSFLRDSIPAWARIHYARSHEALPGAPGSSTEGSDTSSRNVSPVIDSFPVGIHRPRNRPHQADMARRGSMEINPAPRGEAIVEIRGPPRRKVTQNWSPRLPHDKAAARKSTIWKAPSLDERAESNLLSRRNLQIVMFTVGFMFPFAWMIASFLPLPPKPIINNEKTSRIADIEQAMEQELGPIEEARHQNAKWWRNVNRIMSIVGIFIILTIIILAVVAGKMHC